MESLITLESVVTLSKGEIDSETIFVDFSLEDFDMSSFTEDPTYAQVKRKCDLEVRECCNKPKSENSRTSVCPPEKEEVIMDAFRYFGMI